MKKDKLKRRLKVVPIDSLVTHEKTIPSRVRTLKGKIKKEAVFTDPIIITELSNGKYLIMDGMHRYKAVRELGGECLPCFEVDYSEVEVKRWIRSVEGEISKEKYHDLNFEKRNGDLYQIEEGIKGFRNMKELEERLGRNPEYNSHPVNNKTSIIPPKLSPEEIKKAVRQGRRFPPKSTRHVLRQRIIGVDLPLECLFDLKKAGETLRKRLTRSKLKFLGGEKTIEGRFYEEREVYRLESKNFSGF